MCSPSLPGGVKPAAASAATKSARGLSCPKTCALEDHTYPAGGAEEHFLNFRTPGGKIAAYLRLSLPGASEASTQIMSAIPELAGCAMVREVHVYGQVQRIGSGQEGAAQHVGLGTRLLEEAARIALASGFHKLAVISAVGTRKYYESRGFKPFGSLHDSRDPPLRREYGYL